MPVSAYLESRDGDRPLGTYLVYDSDGRPQYVGYSRNMVLAIKVGPQAGARVALLRGVGSRSCLHRRAS